MAQFSMAEAQVDASHALRCKVRNNSEAALVNKEIKECRDFITYLESLPDTEDGLLYKHLAAAAGLLENRNEKIARYCGAAYANAVCPVDYKF